MSQLLQRPQARIALGLAAVVVVGLVAAGVYVFGGNRGGAAARPTAAAPTLPAATNGTVFTIDPSGSEATFTIDEVLFGQPNTVIGKTSQVSGQIRVDQLDPSRSQVGQMRVDLTTLVTDNDLRNRTLQGRILETGDPSNQYATFVAKSLSGLPETTVAIGQPVSFQITGDLTIHHVTRTVTFDAQVTLLSASALGGQAHATVRYADFGIAIPNVPSVTQVSENVVVALSFSAHS